MTLLSFVVPCYRSERTVAKVTEEIMDHIRAIRDSREEREAAEA